MHGISIVLYVWALNYRCSCPPIDDYKRYKLCGPHYTTSLSIVDSILGPLYNQPMRILKYKNHQILDYCLSTLTNQCPPNFGAIIQPTHDNSKIQKIPNTWSFFSHSNNQHPPNFWAIIQPTHENSKIQKLPKILIIFEPF